MTNYKLLYKDEFYGLYKHKDNGKFTYRCSNNFDVIFCHDCYSEEIIASIERHLRLKHTELRAMEFHGKESVFYQEIKERIESLYRIKEVVYETTHYH